jgi:ASCH domain-containing protein
MRKNKAGKMNFPQSSRNNKTVIKALTIRQPWAELILRGRKPYELRSWRTHYRGPLVIHAAAKIDAEDARHFGLNPEKLIAGAFVGVVILADVRPYSREDARLLKKRRAGFGWFPHNFSWVVKRPRRITPIKAKGQLSLFKVPKAVERQIGRLISRAPMNAIRQWRWKSARKYLQ